MIELENYMNQMQSHFTHATIEEKALQDVNDTTNTRVIVFGVLSLLVFMMAGIAQMLYLKRFFRMKKII